MKYIQIIEETLGDSLNSLSQNYTNDQFELLYHRLIEFHDTTDFPKKPQHELCPHLGGHWLLGNTFKYYAKEYWPGRENPPKFNLSIVDISKKHLLYSHSIALEDVLVYLLKPYSKTAYSNTNNPRDGYNLRILDALKDYGKIKPLINQGLIKMDYKIYDREWYRRRYPTTEFENYYVDKFGKFDDGSFSAVMKNDENIKRLDGRVDNYFGGESSMNMYRELLNYLNIKYTSNEIKQPYFASNVGAISSINYNAITIEDFISIRKNEDIYFMWRNFVKDILHQLHEEKNEYTDVNNQFLNIAKEKFNELDSTIKKKMHNAKVMNELIDSTQQAVIGVVIGAFAGNALDMSAEVPMLVGATSPYIKFLIDSMKSIYPIGNTIAMNNHFLSFKLK